MLDVNKIRNDFPMLRDDSLIYLDNGATTFKPQVVIDAMNNYYNRTIEPIMSAKLKSLLLKKAYTSSVE